jgi:hypothetical protein
MNRITGALTFRRQAYTEVEHDAGFTNVAWLLVVVANFLGQLGANAVNGVSDPIQWAWNTIIGTVFAVGAFVVVVAIVNGVGRQAFKAEVTYEELVRTLGLASVWSAVGVLGILAAISSSFSWVVGLARLAAFVLGLAASLVAAKEALDLEWLKVIITVIVAWVVGALVLALAGVFLALFGFGGRALEGILG